MNDRPDNSEPTARGWIAAVLHPFFLFQAVVEVCTAWLFTRSWHRIGFGCVVLLVILMPVGLVVRGAWLERDDLLLRYSLLVKEELRQVAEKQAVDKPAVEKRSDQSERFVLGEGQRREDEDPRDEPPEAGGGHAEAEHPQQEHEKASARASLMREDETNAYADLLYRRLLRLNDQDPHTRYMIALRLSQTGRVSQARQFMQELSPVGGKGYPPAHAWLAVDLLSRPLTSPAAHSALAHHLSEALNWDGVGGGMLTVYAQLLANSGKRKEALDVMARAVDKDARLQSMYVLMARRLNMPKLAEDAAAASKAELLEKVGSTDAVEQDFVQLCMLQLTDNEPEAALKTARKGLRSQAPESQPLKHLASEALRLLYRQSIQQSESGLDLNLALLDEAMRMYPSNPNLSSEIAQLGEMGISAPPAFKAALQQQLLNGQATALAHLLLANQEIRLGHVKDALPHLELALRQAPSHPVILNNLALALALTNRQQLDRAERLIDQAIAINSRNPEYYDTQGEIRLMAGRPLDAIESLETAIAISSDRPHTRQLMIKAYRAAGMEDMAAQQEEMLADSKPTAESPES